VEPLSSRGQEHALTHAFVISTNAGPALAKHSKFRLGSVENKIVSEFDFRTKSPEELDEWYDARAFVARYGALPSAGAVGCAAAHRHCYEVLIQDGGDCAIVLEDDFVMPDGVDKIIENMLSLPIEWDVINLKITNGIFCRRPVAKTLFGRLYCATLYQFGAYAYLITRDCAARFVGQQRPKLQHLSDWPLETWKFRCLGLETEKGHFSGRSTTVQTEWAPVRNTLPSMVHRSRMIQWRMRRHYRMLIHRDVALNAPT
jgi:GR25 family glycosyltransferase involved in LPS biosynthesis